LSAGNCAVFEKIGKIIMNREKFVEILKKKSNSVIKSVVIWTLVFAVILGIAYLFNVIILVRICLLAICIPPLYFLWWRFILSLMKSPGTYISGRTAKLLMEEPSPVRWMYASQLTRTQYGSTVGVENDIVIGLKNKYLLKINYSNKAYQTLENTTLDVGELTNFIQTELLEKDGRNGYSDENAQWFLRS
jgi:hypothetical protein